MGPGAVLDLKNKERSCYLIKEQEYCLLPRKEKIISFTFIKGLPLGTSFIIFTIGSLIWYML